MPTCLPPPHPPPRSARRRRPTHLMRRQNPHKPQLISNSSIHAMPVRLDLKDLSAEGIASLGNDGDFFLALLFQLGVPRGIGGWGGVEDGLFLACLWEQASASARASWLCLRWPARRARKEGHGAGDHSTRPTRSPPAASLTPQTHLPLRKPLLRGLPPTPTTARRATAPKTMIENREDGTRLLRAGLRAGRRR